MVLTCGFRVASWASLNCLKPNNKSRQSDFGTKEIRDDTDESSRLLPAAPKRERESLVREFFLGFLLLSSSSFNLHVSRA